MAEATPVVYLLHGEDEYAIARFVSEMEKRVGDPASAALNVTRLEGNDYNLNELLSVASVMPFLADRRLVVLVEQLKRLSGSVARDRFRDQLSKIPDTTALVIVEYHTLTIEKDRRKDRIHWLEKWASEQGERVYLRNFPLPRGDMMVRRIQEQAGQAGGQITRQGAELLSSLVEGDPRLADQEIHKLLAYVNYNRPVEPDDVELLTADLGQGNIFAMVDALGNQNGRLAMGMLRRLLEQQEPIPIFGMVVRQFRLLLLAREVLDHGGNKGDITRQLKVPPFVADKLILQARRFSIPVLEAIYHRLLGIDEAIKTGKVPGDLALDTLVAALTSP
jgi:DNA polymerase-3 subunit delta